ncbi:MAG: cytochrome-c oxidase, cbb3-type subunit III [Azoarcus sp.]|jgi:cytochrome c oxidase cbb3-type subunit 3|nr:cytochrome-c oxidase, cbb3-type subunit III [Azoarcus sp.]
MADLSGFWNVYVMGLIAFGLLFCLVVLVTNLKASGDGKLQGHVWDETLQEYNNPLPQWWMYLFWFTVIFAVGYLAIFPGFGTFNQQRGAFREYTDEIAKANAKYEPLFQKYQETDLLTLASDANANATGKRLFGTYCAQCHGSLGEGGAPNAGFPNLTDNDWLYGGDPATIKASIAAGRRGSMTPFGQVLNSEQIEDVADYVRSLSNLTPASDRTDKGQAVFAAQCAVCHGPDGRGAASMGASFAALGAPNLTDTVWLYGSDRETIIKGITQGRNAGPGSLTNEMPAWQDFLGEGKVHVLAAYVYSLSKK